MHGKSQSMSVDSEGSEVHPSRHSPDVFDDVRRCQHPIILARFPRRV